MNKVINRLFILGLGMSSLASVGFAKPKVFEIDSKQSSIGFLVIGDPGFLKINGEGGQVLGQAIIKEEANQKPQLSGEFTVNLAAVKTGIKLRDEHMHKKYLETEKFPTAVLKLEPVAITGSGSQEIEFSGSLTIKGVSKEVRGTVKLDFSSDGKSASGDALIKANLNDFPIGMPTYLGISLAEELEISAKFVAKLVQ